MKPDTIHGFLIGAESWGRPTLPARPAGPWNPRLFPSTTPGVGSDAAYLREISTALYEDELEFVPIQETVRNLAWLDEVYSLVARGSSDEATDILFEHIDNLLRAGEFGRCNDLFRTIDLKRFDSNLLIALLSITLPAAHELRDRPDLVRRVERRLAETAPDRVDRLLHGLR